MGRIHQPLTPEEGLRLVNGLIDKKVHQVERVTKQGPVPGQEKDRWPWTQGWVS